MKAEKEVYKGIEYVRIFSLPDDQKVKIWETLQRDKVIKILKDTTLLSDCVQYEDYKQWYFENYKAEVITLKSEPVQVKSILAAIK